MVADCREFGVAHYLGLEAVRQDIVDVVLDQVPSNSLDAARDWTTLGPGALILICIESRSFLPRQKCDNECYGDPTFLHDGLGNLDEPFGVRQSRTALEGAVKKNRPQPGEVPPARRTKIELLLIQRHHFPPTLRPCGTTDPGLKPWQNRALIVAQGLAQAARPNHRCRH